MHSFNGSLKAFDCISHKLIIAKFRSYGLSMSACHLLTSYTGMDTTCLYNQLLAGYL